MLPTLIVLPEDVQVALRRLRHLSNTSALHRLEHRHPELANLLFEAAGDLNHQLRRSLLPPMGSARLNAALAIRVEDVNLDAHVLLINGTKTEAGRRAVPIHPHLAQLLRDSIGGRTLGLLFPNPYGPKGETSKPWNPRRVNTKFKAAAAGLGMSTGRANTGLTTHSLRRFFATTVAMARIEPCVRKIWMGHTTKDIDDHYIRPTPAEERDLMATVPFPAIPKEDTK